MAPESGRERRKRLSQRALFDDVAELYDATRQSYPNEIVEMIVRTAGLEPGSSVLEIGCGTGQLTRKLAGRGLDITAIDIGPAMVAGAKCNVADPKIAFQVSSFEEFEASQAFDLIVSATAFHWVDPELGLAKAARLLRPSGWLALLTTGERYNEPLRSAVRELWAKYNPGQANWPRELHGPSPYVRPTCSELSRGGPRGGSRTAGPDSPRSGMHPSHLPQLQQFGPAALRRRP